MDYLRKPWVHQFEGINRAVKERGFGFFFDVGTGKSATLVNTLRHKYMDAQRVKRTLILCPPVVCPNWVNEFKINSRIPEKLMTVLDGTGKHREKAVRETGKDIPIFITNYESLLMKGLFEALMEWQPEILVLDESHKCKDIKSKRTKAAIQIADQADFVYLLTGTPFLNNYMDYFSQFRIMDGGETFGKNFFAFRNRYFVNKNANAPAHVKWAKWEIGPGAKEEMDELIAEKSMYVSKDEALDLPPLVKTTIEVGLSKAQQKVYDDMKRDFIAFVEDEACVAELAVTKALRLQQIASGFIPVKGESNIQKNVRFKENPRAVALKQLLEDLVPSHKVIIWAVFKENYESIREVCDSLKLKYAEVNGEVSAKNKAININLFNNSKDVNVFIGHPASAGIGINLIASDCMIFYSRNFSLENDIQAEARCYRGGSEIHKKVTRFDLISPGTIDEIVSESLAQKKKIGFEGLRKMAYNV